MIRFWKQVSIFLPATLISVVLLLLTTAWFQIQAVRLGYRMQELRKRADELAKKEESLDQKLMQCLSLARLDELAKNKFQLQVPLPSQIIRLNDSAGV